MAYVGETLTCRVRPTDSVTQDIVADAVCTAYFFAPPKNPQTTPGDRASPDHTVTVVYDPVSRYYLASILTVGWVPGTWWVRAVISGGTGNYLGWQYASFSLQA